MHLRMLSLIASVPTVSIPIVWRFFFFTSLRMSCASSLTSLLIQNCLAPLSTAILSPAALPHSQSSCGLLVLWVLGSYSPHIREGKQPSYFAWSRSGWGGGGGQKRFPPPSVDSCVSGSPLLRYSCISLLVLTKFHRGVEASSASCFYKSHKSPYRVERS